MASFHRNRNAVERGTDSVVVSKSLWYADSLVQYPVTADMVYLVLKPGSRHWGLSIPQELENHVNVGPVSIWDVKEPLRMTSTLAVTTLSASIERSTWCKCSEKH